VFFNPGIGDILLVILIIIASVPIISIVYFISIRTLRSQLQNLEINLQSRTAELIERVYQIEQLLKLTNTEPVIHYQEPSKNQTAEEHPVPMEIKSLTENLLPVENTAFAANTVSAEKSQESKMADFSQVKSTEELQPSSPVENDQEIKSRIEWETIIGGKWSLWVGSLAVFLAAAFFLAYEWQNFGPGEKISIGILSGIIFMLAGELSRQTIQEKFGEGLLGTGLALLYLTIWAGVSVYSIFTLDAAFLMMCFITLIGIALSLMNNSENLCFMSTAGGFLTPLLLHSGITFAQNYQLTLILFYLTILDAGILILSLYKRWISLKWLSFIGTIVCVSPMFLWTSLTISTKKPIFFSFFTLYYFLFFATSCFYSLIHREQTKAEDLILLLADTAAYALSISSLHLSARFPAGFPLFLSMLYFSTAWLVYSNIKENLILRNTLLGIAIFFLTIAIPLQLHQGEISIGWAVESAVLITLGTQFEDLILLREGQIVWALSLGATLFTILTGRSEPHLLFLNQRSLPLLLNFMATLWITYYTAKKKEGNLIPAYILAASLEGAWLLAQETYLGFSWAKFPSPSTWIPGAIDFTSILWAGYAVLLTFIGLKFQSLYTRTISQIILLLASILTLIPTFYLNPKTWLPFFNLRFGAFAAAILAAYLIYTWTIKNLVLLTEQEKQNLNTAALIIFILGLWGLTQEVYISFWFSRSTLGPHWDRAAQLGISLTWVLCGTLLLIAGIIKKYQLLRILAFGLLGLTILKVFLLDLQFLPTSYRILSFLGLGLALIGISFLYSRFGRNIESE
jgi:uncharacterized membrane protein